MGTFYRSRHELILVFKKGTSAHLNTFGLGETGRYRTNVWEYPGINTFRNDRGDELAMHPTVKPVALVADAIKDMSRRGHLVLDAFGRSGTTLIAAEKTRRKARLLELDLAYCDVICHRFEAYTGKPAIFAELGSPGRKLPIFGPKRRLRRRCHEWHDGKHHARRTGLSCCALRHLRHQLSQPLPFGVG